MTSIERELQAIRGEMRRLSGDLPALLTFKQAGRELSVSLTKVKQMVRAGIIQTVRLEPNGHPRIPAGEVSRLSVPPPTRRHPVSNRHQRPKTGTAAGRGQVRKNVRAALRKMKDR